MFLDSPPCVAETRDYQGCTRFCSPSRLFSCCRCPSHPLGALIFLTSVARRNGLSNRTRNALLGVSAVMYAVSATHWALVIAIAIRGLRVGKILVTPPKALAIVYLPTINYILSDGIVLWRAWVLWDRRVTLFVPPLLFLVCTLVTSIVSAVYAYDGSVTKSGHQTNMSHAFGWSIWGFTVGTNLWSTSLIFIRTWQHRRFLRSLLCGENVTSKAERTLAFLVESGAVYLCIWVAYITITANNLPGVLLFHTTIVQLVGIYPTTIVIVVTMRLSAADILTRPGLETRHYPTSMVFTPPSPTPQSSVTETLASSSGSSSIAVSRDDRSTRTLASNDPEKGGEIDRAGPVT
ncbi:hypothetical protein BJV78DRAFT_356190 [Lactifluus subvellereus]|nr:hypothetical protein BJV78DRAFT_356190 [Lactifluus subvellereus]